MSPALFASHSPYFHSLFSPYFPLYFLTFPYRLLLHYPLITLTLPYLITGGDISYAMGYMAVWDFFLNMISPISSKVLYLTTVGNHESDYPNTGN
jgi:hypothetical protein